MTQSGILTYPGYALNPLSCELQKQEVWVLDSLNSLKVVIWGNFLRVIKGNARSL